MGQLQDLNTLIFAKRLAWPQQPNVYLEPKWLQCKFLKPRSSQTMTGTPHDWSWACLWAGPMNINFECVQHVCYDSENALLEYGHKPRPLILHVKKKHGKQPRDICPRKKLCSRFALALGRVAQIQVDRGYLVGIDVPLALSE